MKAMLFMLISAVLSITAWADAPILKCQSQTDSAITITVSRVENGTGMRLQSNIYKNDRVVHTRDKFLVYHDWRKDGSVGLKYRGNGIHDRLPIESSTPPDIIIDIDPTDAPVSRHYEGYVLTSFFLPPQQVQCECTEARCGEVYKCYPSEVPCPPGSVRVDYDGRPRRN